MLEEDLQLLKSLFDAEGEGLSRQQIEELCAPLAGLLVVMQLDSGILMGNYKQVLAAVVLCMHFSEARATTTGASPLPCSFTVAASPQDQFGSNAITNGHARPQITPSQACSRLKMMLCRQCPEQRGRTQ